MPVTSNWVKEEDINVSRTVSAIEENDVGYAAPTPGQGKIWHGLTWSVLV
jgi:hypothetical protein